MQDPPDALGKGIRFGCGALFGAVVGASTFLTLIPEKWHLLALLATGAALLCGFLALRWGDDFWSWLAEHSWWWR